MTFRVLAEEKIDADHFVDTPELTRLTFESGRPLLGSNTTPFGTSNITLNHLATDLDGHWFVYEAVAPTEHIHVLRQTLEKLAECRPSEIPAIMRQARAQFSAVDTRPTGPGDLTGHIGR